MNPKITILRAALFFAAFLPASALRANDDIRVDVVVDMTDAGKKVARPTIDKPAYYFPLTVGYKEQGAFIADQGPPPATLEVQHLIAKALYDQGYRVTNAVSPASLVLVFWWGHISPSLVSTEAGPALSHTSVFNGKGFNAEDPRELVAQLPTDEAANEKQMISIVAGNTRDYQYATEKPSPKLEQILVMERSPRHYMLVSAFDFQDWVKHKTTLLWQAHISTELEGHTLGEVLPTLIATAAPMFGRETTAPELIAAPVAPMGRVIVGTPEVKNYPR